MNQTATPWSELALPGQLPPDTNHHIFLFLAGRGAGRTRSGAEWLVDRCERYPIDADGTPTEHLVVASSLSQARMMCIEGPSGIFGVLDRKGYWRGADYTYRRSPYPVITFRRTGVRIVFLGAHGDAGRGLHNASLWLDDIDEWPGDPLDLLWGRLLPSLRCAPVGDMARAFVSANHLSEKMPVVQELLCRDDTAVSRGNTMMDNAANLPPHFIAEMRSRYGWAE